MKYFSFYLLLSLLFSSLIACGGSDSKSSGDKKGENSDSLQTNQETNKSTIKDCIEGDNPLKDGESCKISNNVYTCKAGRVSGPSLSSGGKLEIQKYTVYCE